MMETRIVELTGEKATGPNASSRQLHDRATRGETLTEAEQSNLAAWYERQDAEEAKMEANFQSYIDELRRLNEQMARDDIEIARLRAETEAIAVESRAIGARTQIITNETRTIAAESRTIGEESRAIGEQMKALRQETLAAIARLGTN